MLPDCYLFDGFPWPLSDKESVASPKGANAEVAPNTLAEQTGEDSEINRATERFFLITLNPSKYYGQINIL